MARSQRALPCSDRPQPRKNITGPGTRVSPGVGFVLLCVHRTLARVLARSLSRPVLARSPSPAFSRALCIAPCCSHAHPSAIKAALATTKGKVGLDSARWYVPSSAVQAAQPSLKNVPAGTAYVRTEGRCLLRGCRYGEKKMGETIESRAHKQERSSPLHTQSRRNRSAVGGGALTGG